MKRFRQIVAYLSQIAFAVMMIYRLAVAKMLKQACRLKNWMIAQCVSAWHYLCQDIQKTKVRWANLLTTWWQALQKKRSEDYGSAATSVVFVCLTLYFCGFFGVCGKIGTYCWKTTTGQTSAEHRTVSLEATWCVQLMREHYLLTQYGEDADPELKEVLVSSLTSAAETDALIHSIKYELDNVEEIISQFRREAYIPAPISTLRRLFNRDPKPPLPPITWTEEAKLLISDPDALRVRLTRNTRLRHYLLQREGKQPETSAN